MFNVRNLAHLWETKNKHSYYEVNLLYLRLTYLNLPLPLFFRCYVEIGGEFQYDIVPTPEMLSTMLEKSPVTHVKKVRSLKKHLELSCPVFFRNWLVSLFNGRKVSQSPNEIFLLKGENNTGVILHPLPTST